MQECYSLYIGIFIYLYFIVFYVYGVIIIYDLKMLSIIQIEIEVLTCL